VFNLVPAGSRGDAVAPVNAVMAKLGVPTTIHDNYSGKPSHG
jgi:hypothetical protein